MRDNETEERSLIHLEKEFRLARPPTEYHGEQLQLERSPEGRLSGPILIVLSSVGNLHRISRFKKFR